MDLSTNLLGALGALLAVVVVGGCSAPAGPGPTPDTRNASILPSTARTSGRPTMPLDAFRPTSKDRYLLAVAETKRTNHCLAQFGVSKRLPAPSLKSIEDSQAIADSRTYGITDRAAAEVLGYHTPDGAAPPAEPSFTADEDLVLEGIRTDAPPAVDPTTSPGKVGGRVVPPGGCVGSARTTLYGTATHLAHFTRATDLAGEAWNTSRSSAPVAAATKAWAACMAGNGFDLTDPMKLTFDGLTPTQDERATAVSDVDCKQSTGFVRTWQKAAVAAEAKLVANHQSELTTERASMDAALAKARKNN